MTDRFARRSALRAASALLLAAASLPACSSGSSSSGGGTTAGGTEAYVASLCNLYARCALDYSAQLASQTRVVAGFILDSASGAYLSLCGDAGRVNLAREMDYQLGLPDLGAFDLAAATRAIDAATCERRPEIAVAPGARAVGRACLSDAQCATSACSGEGGRCGECVQPVAVGGACNASDPKSVCATGSDCSGGTCKAPAATKKAGDPCATPTECGTAAGLTCTNGVCTSFVAALGESCAAKVCRGSVCDAATKLCVAAKTSGACTTSLHCDVYRGYACADATKTCVKFTGSEALGAAGAGCGSQADGTLKGCVAGHVCDSTSRTCIAAASTCTAP